MASISTVALPVFSRRNFGLTARLGELPTKFISRYNEEICVRLFKPAVLRCACTLIPEWAADERYDQRS